MDKNFLAELDRVIEKYSLANRSALIQQWSGVGFERLKRELGIRKIEIAPEVSKPRVQ